MRPSLRHALASLVLLLVAEATSGAQGVVLQIRPRLGDTLRMRLDQHVEMSATAKMRDADSTMSITSSLLVFTRAIVDGRDTAGTFMTATTDSVSLVSSGADSSTAASEARRALLGRRVRLHVAPDGATEVIGGGEGVNPELRALFAQMPATLPRDEIVVGASWSRVMVIPLPGEQTTKGAGTLKATFRFDSLSRDGDMAFLSMRGTLARAPSPAGDRYGATLTMTGAVTGSMIVDRRRGWLTDAHATFTVRSLLTPPPGSPVSPMRFRMKITQWMRSVK